MRSIHTDGNERGVSDPPRTIPFNNNWDIAEREKERRGRRKRN